LAGRDSDDYYEHSVTASRTGTVIPRSSSTHGQRGLGAPLISLNVLTGHRFRREGWPGRTSTAQPRRTPVSGAVPVAV